MVRKNLKSNENDNSIYQMIKSDLNSKKFEKMQFMKLNKNFANKYSNKILEIHNEIPFQKWNKIQLLLDKDSHRTYNLKWEISSICLYNDEVIGICIAFYDLDSHYGGYKNYLYIHRLAVKFGFRNINIGTYLIYNTCLYFRDIVPKEEGDRIIVQTTSIKSLSDKSLNSYDFYKSLNFKKIGFKEYFNRADIVLSNSIQKIINTFGNIS